MEQNRRPTGSSTYCGLAGQRAQSPRINEHQVAISQTQKGSSSLVIGAKTIAGIGVGLLTVISGAALIGVAVETVLVPSLLMKLAGGIAGGGIGMAKGIQDSKKY